MASIKDKLSGFIKGFSKAKGRAIVPYSFSNIADPVIDGIDSAMRGADAVAKFRPLAHSAIGAGVGGGVGAATGETLTPAQKKKNAETKKWWGRLSSKDKRKAENIKRFEKDYTRTRTERAISGALIGGSGAYYASSVLTPMKVQKDINHMVNIVNSTPHKNTEGVMAMTSRAQKAFFERARDVILNDSDTIRRTDFFGNVSKEPIDKAKSLESLLEGLARREKSGLDFPLGPDDRSLHDHYINKFVQSWNKTSRPGIDNVLSRLRSEGISNAREFAKKYHPDTNKSAPKDIKENFGDILEALRGGNTGMSPMDLLVQGIKRESSAKADEANTIIRKYQGRKF
jgi:hypothetical protein